MGSNLTSYVEEESAHGSREVMLEAKHLKNRKIFLTGKIDDEMADRFLQQLLYLEGMSEEPVTVYINSPGGEVNAGLMIYDLIQGSRMDIRLVCAGMAASMAALLLAGGTRGNRYIFPHSKIMIHEPLIANGVGGSATSIRNISDSILETRDILNGLLAEHTGKSIEEINRATEYDHFMNAEEAIQFGICDQICRKLSLDEK